MTAPRLRVGPHSAADRCWQDQGRQHFLNRQAFDDHVCHGSTLSAATPPVSPNALDSLVTLALFLVPFFALWRVIRWMSPETNHVVSYITHRLWRFVHGIMQSVWQLVWYRPVAQFGLAMTLWFWLLISTLAAAVGFMINGLFLDLLFLVPWVLILLIWWYLMRWWRRRYYQVRVLPGRRHAGDDDG